MADETKRDPTDFVQLKIRCRESLRAQVEAGASLGGRSLNDEIVRRLERSFLSDDITRAIRETIRQEMRAEFEARREPGSSIPPQAMRQVWSRPRVVSN